MKHIGKSGAAIAAAALTLALTGATLTVPAAAAGAVKCSGINSCKGTSECATANSSCKGQNSCKGHGWVNAASASDCTTKGGKIVTG